MSKRKTEPLFWGIILLAIGALFLLDNLGVDIDIWKIIGDYWPLILVAIGLKNIWLYYQEKKSG
jgi:lia operon protein LiaF